MGYRKLTRTGQHETEYIATPVCPNSFFSGITAFLNFIHQRNNSSYALGQICFILLFSPCPYCIGAFPTCYCFPRFSPFLYSCSCYLRSKALSLNWDELDGFVLCLDGFISKTLLLTLRARTDILVMSIKRSLSSKIYS